MAVLAAAQVKQLFVDGDADRIVLYAVRNVTTADTFDVSVDFSRAIRAMAVGATVAGATAVTVSGTVVTIPSGLAGDAAWILVYGCAA